MATEYQTANRQALIKEQATGAVAISLSLAAKRVSRVMTVTLKLSAAPTTSENFTITLNALAGVAYDTLLYSVDLSASSTTALIWYPDGELWLEPGDSIDVAYTNTDTRTYGVQITFVEEL